MLLSKRVFISHPKPPLPHISSGYQVTLRKSTIDFGQFHIEYIPENDAVFLWSPTKGNVVHITVVKADTGGGKSSLLLQIYRYLRSRSSSPVNIHFDPDMNEPKNIAVAFLAQKAPTIAHWKVRSLLPDSSAFADALLPQHPVLSRNKMRVGELSGGECARLYASSALEQLSASPTHAAFLLLDETFEGIGEEDHVSQCVNKIKALWTERHAHKHLHMMIVSHKQVGERGLAIPDSLLLSLNVISRVRDHEIQVSVQNT